MSHTKILELAQTKTADLNVAGTDFKVHEPSMLEMNTFRDANDEKEGGSRAKGHAYLIQNFIRNPDGTPAFSEQEAFIIATGSPRVAGVFIKAVMQWVPDVEEKKGKDEAPEGSSNSN
jgi:hypothetical protein